jgi:hypothetical protein
MAFAQEHLDNTIKGPEDVERFLRLPALASIPAVDSEERHGIHSLYERAKVLSAESQPSAALAPAWNKIEANGNHSALLEAFHGLRTSVLLSTAEAPPRTGEQRAAGRREDHGGGEPGDFAGATRRSRAAD